MQKFNKEKPTFKRDLTENKLITRWSSITGPVSRKLERLGLIVFLRITPVF
jgi:hypothetical protein